MIIRPAAMSDAVSGAACHLACRREAYADMVTPERLVALTSDVDATIELWRTVIAEGGPLVVAVEDDSVIGFIAVGPGEEPGLDGAFQLRVLNVRRAYWGTGVAQRLYDHAVGERDAYLWVLRDNARARGSTLATASSPTGPRRSTWTSRHRSSGWCARRTPLPYETGHSRRDSRPEPCRL